MLLLTLLLFSNMLLLKLLRPNLQTQKKKTVLQEIKNIDPNARRSIRSLAGLLAFQKHYCKNETAEATEGSYHVFETKTK
jgi:hypothetical protein